MTAIAAALTAWIFIHVLRMPERWKLNFKPFNCGLCLSFWLAVILYFCPTYFVNFLFTVTLAASIGAWLEK
jgi:hypothetical protein